MSESWSLHELCDRAGVTERTVRYYVAQGLLPSPGLGRGVRYGAEHLSRLRAIRELQESFLPLAEIRARLDAPSGAGDSRPVEASRSQGQDTAAEYVNRLLDQPSPPSPPPVVEASPSRTTWERISLCADVEIHVRRPLTRIGNRKIEDLIRFAQHLFQE